MNSTLTGEPLTGKPLPLQMLRMYLTRATEATALSGDQSRGRALATTLEKHALQLRLQYGGNTFTQGRSSGPDGYASKPKAPKEPDLFRATCCREGYQTDDLRRVYQKSCPKCSQLLHFRKV